MPLPRVGQHAHAPTISEPWSRRVSLHHAGFRDDARARAPRLNQPLAESTETVAKSCPGSCAPGRTSAANGTEDRIGQSQRLTHTSSAKEVEMHRYRLTFDPNAKELARRDSAGTHVALLWSRRRHRAAVVLGRTRPVNSSNSTSMNERTPSSSTSTPTPTSQLADTPASALIRRASLQPEQPPAPHPRPEPTSTRRR